MKKLISTVFTFFLLYLAGYTQTQLGYREIYNLIINDEIKKRQSWEFEQYFYPQILEKVDSLRIIKIDTIGIYLEQYTGWYVEPDTCIGGEPWFGYVFWEFKGKSYLQKITKHCKSEPIEIPYSVLIRYFINAEPRIYSSYILPVIQGGYIDSKGDTIIERSWIDHTIDYTIYCELGEKAILRSFDEYELTTKESIFYDHNASSIINSWKKIISHQLRELTEQ